MKKSIKWICLFIPVVILLYYLFVYFFNYIRWYGYQKWEYRKASQSESESIRRGVFVKKLKYLLVDYSGPSFPFEVFIEYGYKWSRNSSAETVGLTSSQFPYQLRFTARPIEEIGIRIKADQLQKFDSSNSVWGYMRKPKLSDTITLEILGENIKIGIIQVW